LSASGNVEVPAIYAGVDSQLRQQRSAELLSELGLKNGYIIDQANLVVSNNVFRLPVH
jgi:ABC-type lipoprotein export system ATPase subunit